MSEPIVGGTDDPTQAPENNVVVALEPAPGGTPGVGSAVLITPTLMLTASHVLDGIVSPHLVFVVAPGSGPGLWLGPNTHYDNGAFATYVQYKTTGDADDLALVQLDAHDFDVTLTGSSSGFDFKHHYIEFLESAVTIRPSFAIPPHSGPDDAPVFAPQSVFFAGWDHTADRPRQVAEVDSLTNSGLWTFNNSSVYAEGGDSGGPLFFVRPNNDPFPRTRDPFGIEVGIKGNPTDRTIFVDLTQSFVLPWLLPLVIDHAHDNQPTWLAQHPSPFGSDPKVHWKGEFDYTGPCDKSKDADCDHWVNSHDNCPFVFNIDQYDPNDDGIGWVCEDCPCDPDNDPDEDAVCDKCDGSVSALCAQLCSFPKNQILDNCQKAWNPGQENCNLEAEQAVNRRTGQQDIPNKTILGDKCDPVPCPLGNANSSGTGLTQCCPNDPNDPKKGQQCFAEHIHDDIEITPLGAYPLGNDLCNGCGDNQAHVLASHGATDARYCQSDPGATPTPVVCNDVSSKDPQGRGVIDSRQLTFWLDAPSERSDQPLHPWHRMTLGFLQTSKKNGIPVVTCVGSVDVPESIDYAPGVQQHDAWCFYDDWNRWLDTSNPNYPQISLSSSPGCQTPPLNCPNPPQIPTLCLDGTLWRHSEAEIGHTIDTVVNNQGNGHSSQFVGIHSTPANQTIADHYFDVRPDNGLVYCPVTVDPVAAQPLPQPVVLWQAQSPYRGFDVRTYPETEVLLPSYTGGIGALQDDGAGVAVNDPGCGPKSASQVFLTAFGAGLTWVNAAEPNPDVGPVSGGVMAVALAADATSVVDGAVAQGNLLFAASEMPDGGGVLPGGGGGPPTDPPSPRTGFITAFSRSASAAYVIGGRDVQTQAVLHDVWLYDLRSTSWSRADYRDYAPGAALAATFSFRDRKLWLLDAFVDAQKVERVRLARLDAHGGKAEVVGTWKRTGAIDRWFLSVDRDGSVLLAAGKAQHHDVARFDVMSEPPAATSIFREDGALALAPVVDDHTYALVVWHPNQKLEIIRRQDLAHCPSNANPACAVQGSPTDKDLAGLF